MSYIVDGEFPDDEITNITYMLESNDNFDDLLHDLSREDAGAGTMVKAGDRRLSLASVVATIRKAQAEGLDYESAIKPFVDED